MSHVAKKQKSKEVQVVEFRPWAELPPEILGLIFQFLCLEDRLVKLPCVCKSWFRALKGPYCWKEIDIYSWSSKRRQAKRPQRIDRMLQSLIERSGDSFEKLCVWVLSSEDVFALIANNAKNLRTLQLTFSKISGEVLEKIASKFSSLASLDISQCKNVGICGLEAFGENCKNLTSLRYSVCHSVFSEQISNDLAYAIANTMPKLKNLDIRNFQVGTKAVMEIIIKCKELEVLDITGCYGVKISEKYMESFPNLKIVGPYHNSNEEYSYHEAYCYCCGPSDSDDEANNAEEVEQCYYCSLAL